jgi:broad specificity phosphatase PhoE
MNQHQGLKAAAKAPEFETCALIDGNYVGFASDEPFAAVNSTTGEIMAQIAACGEKDFNRVRSPAGLRDWLVVTHGAARLTLAAYPIPLRLRHAKRPGMQVARVTLDGFSNSPRRGV